MTLVLTLNDTPTITGSVGTNIAGATLQAHVRRPDATVVSRTPTAVDAAAGTWTLTFAGGDLNQVGDYYLEIQVTFSGGAIQTFALDARGQEQRFRVRNEYA